jgi:uncharacterized protein
MKIGALLTSMGHLAAGACLTTFPGWAVAADAASFDCAKASSPRERLVCSDATLSELDGHLGKLYDERKKALSAKGADLLQKSERSWLHYVATVCPLPTIGRADDTLSCIKKRYDERLAELAKSGAQLGPYVFGRIDLYAAEPAPDRETGSVPGFYVQHVAYPRIDSPLSPQAEAWNRRAEKTLTTSDDCGQGDDETEYDIGYANRAVISMQWTNSTYCHDTSHGMFDIASDNFVMTPSLRALTGQDVFGTSRDWPKRLRGLFEAALRASRWEPGVGDADSDMKNVEDYMMEPGNWLFRPEGLQVAFTMGVGGCYACNPPPITVAWADLKPLLPPKGLLP